MKNFLKISKNSWINRKEEKIDCERRKEEQEGLTQIAYLICRYLVDNQFKIWSGGRGVNPNPRMLWNYLRGRHK